MNSGRTRTNALTTNICRLLVPALARENDFLRQENRVLRELLPDRLPRLNDRQRRLLVRYGIPIKDRLAEVISIVRPETLLRWHREMKRRKWDYSCRRDKMGRPPIPVDTEMLILKLAEENDWGYPRIAGELKKLGHIVCPTTVANILRKHGLPPSPRRKDLSWKKFIQSHMDETWAADFFTEEVWCAGGLVTCYVLFFIHLGTRRVWIAGVTPNPSSAWVKQQARNFSMVIEKEKIRARYLIHDRETSFLPLDYILKTEDIDIVRTPKHSPWCNGYAERFVREARGTLNNMILFGEGHLHHVMKKIEKHHNNCRPHQGIDNAIPIQYEYPDDPVPLESIRCDAVLGGLLNHYHADKAA